MIWLRMVLELGLDAGLSCLALEAVKVLTLGALQAEVHWPSPLS